jgi:hypothetical protein
VGITGTVTDVCILLVEYPHSVVVTYLHPHCLRDQNVKGKYTVIVCGKGASVCDTSTGSQKIQMK